MLVAGSMAGLALWISTYPFDVAKTILQSQPLERKERTLVGVCDCMAKILRDNGLKGLFVGIDACVLRSVPSTAACFLGYETAITFFN